jgi:RHS repeat-associated protein
VVERYQYEDFGKPTVLHPDWSDQGWLASIVGNERLFQGREYDWYTGLYDYRARHMDPESGRFLSRDPLGMWGDVLHLGNGYTFLNNNPWSMIDPFGLECGNGNQRTWREEILYAMENGLSGYMDLPDNDYFNFLRGMREWTEDASTALVNDARDFRGGLALADPILNLPENVSAAWESLTDAYKSLAAEIDMVGVDGAIGSRRDGAIDFVAGFGADDAGYLAGPLLIGVAGRAGKQSRLRELADDGKLSSADRGWIQQEMNSIDRGQRDSIRNPPGKDLAHERGREAAKGYSYKHSNLQDRNLHKLQHKYDNYGRKNKERPPG